MLFNPKRMQRANSVDHEKNVKDTSKLNGPIQRRLGREFSKKLTEKFENYQQNSQMDLMQQYESENKVIGMEFEMLEKNQLKIDQDETMMSCNRQMDQTVILE